MMSSRRKANKKRDTGLRSASPDFNCGSQRSDRSRETPPRTSDDSTADSNTRQSQQAYRPVSQLPSGVSRKSKRSMDKEPPNMSDDAVGTEQGKGVKRSVSPDESISSDKSREIPPTFSREEKERHKAHTHAVTKRTTLEATVPDASSSDYVRHHEQAYQGDSKTTGPNKWIRVSRHHKDNLKKQFANVQECWHGSAKQPTQSAIDVDLYIADGERAAASEDHGMQFAGPVATSDKAINCHDLFKSSGRGKHVRIVLTKGVACIGKTVVVQRFMLDWADGNMNQDIDFVFFLPFRLLNKLKDCPYSLDKLLRELNPALQQLPDTVRYEDFRVLFICFALDESSFPLDFQNNPKVSNMLEESRLDTLLTSLIQGSLFPSAQIWITSRPVACDQIPVEHITIVTEIRGFTDAQKEEYFRKRISEDADSEQIISHIKANRSLDIMCHLPVFCWIAARVLKHALSETATETGTPMPTTLTEMLVHFLLIQMKRRGQKYESRSEEHSGALESVKEDIMKLSKLAFINLERRNYIFSEEEVSGCGLDLTDAFVRSGLCTDISKGESLIFEKLFTFVHIIVQEFLGALFVFVSHAHKTNEDIVLPALFKDKSKSSLSDVSLDELLKAAINRALESKSGHLDLFIRFLHGLSVESCQGLLQCLLLRPHSIDAQTLNRMAQNLKLQKRPNISPDRWINLLHCLMEMRDYSLHEEVQAFLTREKGQGAHLKLSQCSALANMLLLSGQNKIDLDLSKIKASDEGRRRLIPVVRGCRKAQLAGCRLTEGCFEVVALALEQAQSPLRELDLSHNMMHGTAATRVLQALNSPHCKLQSLWCVCV